MGEVIKQRFLSLDVLRGLTVALMIVVNNPGSWSTIYAPFKHAAWAGFTITDLVFPTFLFVIGNAMSFSMGKYEAQGNQAFFRKVIKRTLLIFLIGTFMVAFPFVYRGEGGFFLKDFSQIRIMGVLQRIALCYFFGSLILHYLNVKKAIILSVVILLGYWLILWYFGDHPDPYSLKNNAVLKVDLFLLPEQNLWRGFGMPFDPEGILSTLPAIVNVVAGYVAGVFVQKSGNTLRTVLRLVVAGIIILGIAKLWSFNFPIIKGLWTSTFVLYSTGWDLVLLGALIFIIEIAGLKKWTYVFQAFGRNPLFIFVLSGLVVMLMALFVVDGTPLKSWLYQTFYLSWLNDLNASLLYAISFTFIMWLIGYWMDIKKIYIKV